MPSNASSSLQTFRPATAACPETSTGAKTVADNRQLRPPRPHPTPIFPLVIQEVWGLDAPEIRLAAGGGGVVAGDGEAVLENPRRQLRLPAAACWRQVHQLQLLRHDMGALRPVLAAGAADLPQRGVQYAAVGFLRAHSCRRTAGFP